MSPEATPPPVASQWLAPILRNDRIARDTYLVRLEAPELARRIRPGQFVMVRPGPEGSDDPLLGRPFALYDIVRGDGGAPFAIDLVYLVVGRGTEALSRRRVGEQVSIWGPLGNGFQSPPSGPVVFVAGGIGQTPFLALGKWWLGKARYGNDDRGWSPPCSGADMFYGVRNAELLAGLPDFQAAGIAVEVATDDGSAGHHGLVTDLLLRRLGRGERPAQAVACGPPRMLAAVAKICREAGVPCLASLENHMACGFGACFSCVTPILQPDGSSDLRRVCVEGPIFDAAAVDWAGVSHP